LACSRSTYSCEAFATTGPINRASRGRSTTSWMTKRIPSVRSHELAGSAAQGVDSLCLSFREIGGRGMRSAITSSVMIVPKVVVRCTAHCASRFDVHEQRTTSTTTISYRRVTRPRWKRLSRTSTRIWGQRGGEGPWMITSHH
jgi:hypothetical protein